MIVGVGIDSIEIARFTPWPSYAHTTLSRIFSDDEITYCLSNPSKSAERFAARFATREAFYKALSGFNGKVQLPFLSVCKMIQVEKSDNGNPHLAVDWSAIWNIAKIVPTGAIQIHLTFTHNQTTAFALVILEEANNYRSHILKTD